MDGARLVDYSVLLERIGVVLRPERDALLVGALGEQLRAAHALDRELGFGPDVHLPRARVRLRLLVQVDPHVVSSGLQHNPVTGHRICDVFRNPSLCARLFRSPATMVTPGANGFVTVRTPHASTGGSSMFTVDTIAPRGSNWVVNSS